MILREKGKNTNLYSSFNTTKVRKKIVFRWWWGSKLKRKKPNQPRSFSGRSPELIPTLPDSYEEVEDV
jgi:hypothetical protein